MEQTNGKIFLASERGHTETDWFRSYNTFNFGQYQPIHKTPVGALYVLNDDTLAGGKSIQLRIEESSLLLLIPVVGAVAYGNRADGLTVVEAGQCGALIASSNTEVIFENPYEEELINFLQIWIKIEEHTDLIAEIISFDLDGNKNTLLPFTPTQASTKGFLGKYDGRSEDIYRVKDKNNPVFVFVIQGAFEVQNRLLEARDGLALWNVEEVDFEALSSDAILLLVQLPVK